MTLLMVATMLAAMQPAPLPPCAVGDSFTYWSSTVLKTCKIERAA